MRTGGGVVLSLALLALLAVGQQAQRQEEHAQHPPQAATAAQAGQMCRDMMAKQQKMMARIQQMDEQLQLKLQLMNAATGDAKVQAMADVINEMARQRRQIHQDMMATRQEMMSHMAGHMRQDGMQNTADCPMMQAAPGQ